MKVKCVKNVVEYKHPLTKKIMKRNFPYTVGKEYGLEFGGGYGCAKFLSYTDNGWDVFVTDGEITADLFLSMFRPYDFMDEISVVEVA